MAIETSEALVQWARQIGDMEILKCLTDLFADVAIFVVDADRRILFWSQGAENVLGFSARMLLVSTA